MTQGYIREKQQLDPHSDEGQEAESLVFWGSRIENKSNDWIYIIDVLYLEYSRYVIDVLYLEYSRYSSIGPI